MFAIKLDVYKRQEQKIKDEAEKRKTQGIWRTVGGAVLIAVSYTHLDVYKRQLDYRSEDEIGRLAHSMRKSIRILGSYVDDIDLSLIHISK